MLPSMY